MLGKLFLAFAYEFRPIGGGHKCLVCVNCLDFLCYFKRVTDYYPRGAGSDFGCRTTSVNAIEHAVSASTVTVTGGFTSFSGIAGGTNDGINSTLTLDNGQSHRSVPIWMSVHGRL